MKIVKVIELQDGKKVQEGDVINIKYPSGGGMGGCKITKITDTGFYFN